MRLHLLTPPALVTVVEGGVARPALLLAVRGDRRYVQVSRGAGLNHLRWVPEDAVRPGPPTAAEMAAQSADVLGSAAPAGGRPGRVGSGSAHVVPAPRQLSRPAGSTRTTVHVSPGWDGSPPSRRPARRTGQTPRRRPLLRAR